MKFKGIIFDMDGVIFDSEKIYLKNWQDVFESYGYSLKKETYVRGMGIGKEKIKELFREEYGQDLLVDEMYIEKDKRLNKYLENIELKSGVIEILKYLKDNNYKVSIATSSRKSRVITFLESKNISNYFDEIVCSDDVVNFKPNPEVFLSAAKKLNLDVNECLVVEDSYAGLLASKNANIKAIHIPDLRQNDDISNELSFKVFSNLLEFKDFLKLNN
ncbi:MAG: HAD family phosphatase [Peptostreptococcaceae bacterium]